MSEITQLITTLKRELKRQGKTYRDVGAALGLSEPSVKRLFATEQFTLERLLEVCTLLGLTLAELTQEAGQRHQRIHTLSAAQERELVSDLRLLLVSVCALNHWTMEQMLQVYRLSEADCVQQLVRLDRLALITLLPGNRIRLNVARDFDWLPDGPIRRYFREQGMPDFIDSGFRASSESLDFVHGMLTESARAKLQAELRQLRARFAQLHEESLAAPLPQRRGTGLLLALREWEPSAFAALRR
ncbi:helix-turn-helix transcriptional regulator [Massilia sp. G4R7]|uniref:Helix-turn-helix transcriptional regulator n=1 Tax=Massilia phyllostachyos TaxID=2898585 RepID=A0ABS8QD40_9BURK|nr:helix-turn-helix transcriptional regulator [Massilia phyllostachyos]MCD2519671.1 helix-turn-helix transcriptional regulator [Massilia phyllostachyos]